MFSLPGSLQLSTAASAGLTSNVKQILVCICMYSFSALTVFFACLFPVSFVCICQ